MNADEVAAILTCAEFCGDRADYYSSIGRDRTSRSWARRATRLRKIHASVRMEVMVLARKGA